MTPEIIHIIFGNVLSAEFSSFIIVCVVSLMENLRKQGLEPFRVLNGYLKRIGMSPKNDGEFSRIFALKAFFFIAIIQGPAVFGILCFSYVSIKGSIYSDLIPVIYALNFISVLQICFIIFIFRGQQTLNFVNNLSSMKYGKPKNFRKVLDLINKLTTILFWTTLMDGITFAVANYYKNAYCEAKLLLNDSKFVCGLLVPFWFPLEIPMAKQFFFILSMGFLFVTVSQSAANILCIGSILLVLKKIEHLKGYLIKINFIGENSSATREKLIVCIKYYTEIVDLVQEFNTTVGYIFSAQQNVMVIVTIGVLEYQTVTEKSPIAAIQLLCWLMVEFVSCYSGQILENASNSLAEIVYDLHWYEMDPSLRKTFRLFHCQVQCTLQFRILPLIVMNMQYFHKVVKGSYSLLMFLKND